MREPRLTCAWTNSCNILDGTAARTVSPTVGPAGQNPTTPEQGRTAVTGFIGGMPLDEAKSLLRPCLPRGQYGNPLTSLPEPLESLIGKKMKLTASLIAAYLKANGISDADLGGPLATSLPKARYFVIHDTSSALKSTVTSFPENINTTGWAHNKRASLQSKTDAHVFVSRVGESNTAHDFTVPYSATKYTMHQSQALKEKFCHVELIQPRLMHHGSDWQAPKPGFPIVQLERLALIYIVASARHDEWLVPAYHHNVDIGFSAHDDPQNFDLTEWAKQVENLTKEILGVPQTGDFSGVSGSTG